MPPVIPLFHDEKARLEKSLGKKANNKIKEHRSATGPGRLRVMNILSKNPSRTWATYQAQPNEHKKKIIVSNPLLWFCATTEQEWRLWRALFAMGYEIYIWKKSDESAFLHATPIATVEQFWNEIKQIQPASVAEVENALAEQGVSSKQYHIWDLNNYNQLINDVYPEITEASLYLPNNLLQFSVLPYHVKAFNLISQATQQGKGLGFKLVKPTVEQLKLLLVIFPQLEKLTIELKRTNESGRNPNPELSLLMQFKSLKVLYISNWKVPDNNIQGLDNLEELTLIDPVLEHPERAAGAWEEPPTCLTIALPKLTRLHCTVDRHRTYKLKLINTQPQQVHLDKIKLAQDEETLNNLAQVKTLELNYYQESDVRKLCAYLSTAEKITFHNSSAINVETRQYASENGMYSDERSDTIYQYFSLAAADRAIMANNAKHKFIPHKIEININNSFEKRRDIKFDIAEMADTLAELKIHRGDTPRIFTIRIHVSTNFSLQKLTLDSCTALKQLFFVMGPQKVIPLWKFPLQEVTVHNSDTAVHQAHPAITSADIILTAETAIENKPALRTLLLRNPNQQKLPIMRHLPSLETLIMTGQDLCNADLSDLPATEMILSRCSTNRYTKFPANLTKLTINGPPKETLEITSSRLEKLMIDGMQSSQRSDGKLIGTIKDICLNTPSLLSLGLAGCETKDTQFELHCPALISLCGQLNFDNPALKALLSSVEELRLTSRSGLVESTPQAQDLTNIKFLQIPSSQEKLRVDNLPQLINIAIMASEPNIFTVISACPQLQSITTSTSNTNSSQLFVTTALPELRTINIKDTAKHDLTIQNSPELQLINAPDTKECIITSPELPLECRIPLPKPKPEAVTESSTDTISYGIARSSSYLPNVEEAHSSQSRFPNQHHDIFSAPAPRVGSLRNQTTTSSINGVDPKIHDVNNYMMFDNNNKVVPISKHRIGIYDAMAPSANNQDEMIFTKSLALQHFSPCEVKIQRFDEQIKTYAAHRVCFEGTLKPNELTPLPMRDAADRLLTVQCSNPDEIEIIWHKKYQQPFIKLKNPAFSEQIKLDYQFSYNLSNEDIASLTAVHTTETNLSNQEIENIKETCSKIASLKNLFLAETTTEQRINIIVSYCQQMHPEKLQEKFSVIEMINNNRGSCHEKATVAFTLLQCCGIECFLRDNNIHKLIEIIYRNKNNNIIIKAIDVGGASKYYDQVPNETQFMTKFSERPPVSPDMSSLAFNKKDTAVTFKQFLLDERRAFSHLKEKPITYSSLDDNDIYFFPSSESSTYDAQLTIENLTFAQFSSLPNAIAHEKLYIKMWDDNAIALKNILHLWQSINVNETFEPSSFLASTDIDSFNRLFVTRKAPSLIVKQLMLLVILHQHGFISRITHAAGLSYLEFGLLVGNKLRWTSIDDVIKKFHNQKNILIAEKETSSATSSRKVPVIDEEAIKLSKEYATLINQLSHRDVKSIVDLIKFEIERPRFCADNDKIAIAFNQAIMLAMQACGMDTLRQHIYIDHPDQMEEWFNTAFIQDQELNEADGPLKKMLTANCIIVVNWRKFKTEDMVKYHSILDTPPTLHGELLSANNHIINITPTDKALLECFDTRCTKITMTDSWQLKNEDVINCTDMTETINLHHIPFLWDERLLGEPTLLGQGAMLEDGPLIRAIKSNKQLIIYNPPTTQAFKNFIANINSEKKVFYNDAFVEVPENFTIQYRYTEQTPQPTNVQWLTEPQLTSTIFHININSFWDLQKKLVILDGKAEQRKEWLGNNEKKDHITLIIDENLPAGYWSQMMEWLGKTYGDCQFSIYVSSRCDRENIPYKLPSVKEIAELESCTDKIYCCNDGDFVTTQLKQEHPSAFIMPATLFTHDQDILRQIKHEKKEFSDEIRLVLAKLLDGKTVILNGEISPILYQELIPLLTSKPRWYLNGEWVDVTGKLILVMPESSAQSLSITHYTQKMIKRTEYAALLKKTHSPQLIDRMMAFLSFSDYWPHAGKTMPESTHVNYARLERMAKTLTNHDNDNPIKGLFHYNYIPGSEAYAYLNTIAKYFFSKNTSINSSIKAGEKLSKLLNDIKIESNEDIIKHQWHILNCLNAKQLYEFFGKDLNAIDVKVKPPKLSATAHDKLFAIFQELKKSLQPIKDPNKWERKLYQQMLSFMQNSAEHILYLKGASGVGKTHCIKDFIARLDNKKFSKFYGIREIAACFEACEKGLDSVIFLDEITLLQPGVVDFVKQFSDGENTVTYNNKIYTLKKLPKIFAAGNPHHYAGCNEQKTIVDYGTTFFVKKMPDITLSMKFIEPALKRMALSEKQRLDCKEKILHVFRLAEGLLPIESVTNRDLKSLLNRFIFLYNKEKRNLSVEQILYKACYQEFAFTFMAGNRRQQFISQMTDIVDINENDVTWSKNKGDILPVRHELIETLLTDMEMLTAERQKKSSTEPVFGSSWMKSSLLLTGPSGVGKSRTFVKLLESFNYQFNHPDVNKRYYQINAGSISCDNLLRKALAEKCPIIIDESYLLTTEQNVLLNDYMTRPGTMVFMTKNPSNSSWCETDQSLAPENRQHKLYFDEFEMEELLQIATKRAIRRPEILINEYAKRKGPDVNERTLFHAMKVIEKQGSFISQAYQCKSTSMKS